MNATRSIRRDVTAAVVTIVLIVTAVVVASPRPAAGAGRFAPAAGERDFSLRYSNNVNGQITIAANTIMKCPVDTTDAAANSACSGSRAGTNARNNNSYDMQWLDYDSDPSTFDSSRADLVLPVGGHVLFAGLYWTGVQVKGDVITYANGSKGTPRPAPNPALIGQVSFRVPGSSTYATVTASTIDTGPISLGSGYGAFADVTSLVRSAGAGGYYVGNVQTGTGGNTFGGWSLVVAYSDPTEPLRNLSVFDGLKVVGGSSSIVIPLSGFRTPSSGTVRTTVGVVAAEGDAGATGDYLMVDNNRLTDAVHPANNTENSTIANRGAQVTTKGPDWRNQLGYDSSLFAADGYLPNGATTATFTAQTTGDTYAPQAISFATELYSPAVTFTKAADVTAAQPGDTITYTLTTANTALTATAFDAVITDALPGSVTFKSLSLPVGAVASCTPACDSSATSVQVSLGELVPGSPVRVVTLEVTVNGDRPLDEIIDNTAELRFLAADLGLPATKVASADVTVAYPDPAIEKAVEYVNPNTNSYGFTISLSNAGSVATSGSVDVVDALGAGASDITVAGGVGWDCGTLSHPVTTVTCTWSASLAPGETAQPLEIVGTFPPGQSVVNTAELGDAKGGEPDDPGSPAILNDAAVATWGVAPLSDLVVGKSAVDPEVGLGGVTQFRMLTHNRGPSTSTGTVLTDTVPAGLDVRAVAQSQGTCSTAPGTGGTTVITCAIGEIAVGDDVLVVVTVAPFDEAAGTTIVNTVSVESGTTTAPATDSASLSVRPATDLSITKTADRETASPGEVIHYTVTATNNGPVAAPNVSIIDHLPTAIAFSSANADSSGICQTTYLVIECTWPSELAVGASYTVEISATVLFSFDPGDVVAKHAVNVAQVTSDYDEIDPTDDEASVLVKILPYGDLAATASGPGTVAPGGSAQLTFIGTNLGPTTTTATTMVIGIPIGLVIAWLPSDCALTAPGTVTCDLGTMVQGATTTITVPVVNPLGTAGLVHLVTVSISSEVDDPVPQNNADLTPLYSTSPPSVVSVGPDSGPEDGGTQVTIDGDNLTTDTVVEFGGVPCTPVWFNTAQQLVCTTGPHPPGVVDVVVTTPDGQTFVFVGGFTYIGATPIVPVFTG